MNTNKLKQPKLFGGAIDLTTEPDEPAPAKAWVGKAKPKAATKPKPVHNLVDQPSPKATTRKWTRQKETQAKHKAKSSLIESSDDDLMVRLAPVLTAKADKGKGKAKPTDLEVIEIPDSPPPKKLAPMRPLGEMTKLGQERRKVPPALEARWPTGEEHSGGGERSERDPEPGPSSLAKQRWSNPAVRPVGPWKELLNSQDVFSILNCNLHAPAPSTQSAQQPALVRHSINALSTLLPAFTPHPLLNRLAAPLRAPDQSPTSFLRPLHPDRLSSAGHKDLFTTKYAPRKADEMVGTLSRRSAGELKAWFEELAICSAAGMLIGMLCTHQMICTLMVVRLVADAEALTGNHKRRPIARGSKHRKRRRRATSADDDDDGLDGLDGFVVSTDDEEEDDISSPASDVEADPDSLRPQASTIARRRVFPSLTNLILLHGPRGTGKTSAVHAVAAELGWSVFEVWPGVGKRGAKDVERLVGDVSKNHMVRKGAQAQGGLMSMFSKVAEASKVAGAAEGAAKQSVILFEEVDVVYKDEKDFWLGIMALASESQRPIVMTCTGKYSVIQRQLGLNTG